MRLSSRNIDSQSVNYGEVGFGGQLGFADLFVSVQNRYYPNAIGAHAPSELTFALPQAMQGFSTYVALNDTAESTSTADFLVYADDELIAATHNVRPGEPPRWLEAELYGAKTLRLVANTPHWPGCHTVWVDPVINRQERQSFTGVLGEIDVALGQSIENCDTCIALIVTKGYEKMAEAMLGSLWDNGNCRDATILIITNDENNTCQQLASKFNAITRYVKCSNKDTYIIKSIAYSVARFIRANHYVVVDVDMIVTSSINPLLSSINTVPSSHILICKEQNNQAVNPFISIIDSFAHPYFGRTGDLHNLKVSPQSGQCPLFNGGVISGTREAFLGLESAMRDLMPYSAYWERQEVVTPDGIKVKWREQGVMNAALARTGKWSELNSIYNCQLAVSGSQVQINDGIPTAIIDNQPATIVHFNGIIGRQYYEQVTNNYRDGVSKPFGMPSQSGTTESMILGSKLFRACYRPTASKAFPSIDSFWDYHGLWSVLWDEVSQFKSPRVLDVNTFAMCTSAILLRATESCLGSVEVIAKNNVPEWFSILMNTRLQIGDTELLMNQAHDVKKIYDIVCVDTSNNTRMLMNLLNITKNIIDEDGSLLLLDIQHPVNEISVILDKLRHDGWVDKLVFSHADIALYRLKKHG